MSIHLCLSSGQRHSQTATGQEGCRTVRPRAHKHTHTEMRNTKNKKTHSKPINARKQTRIAVRGCWCSFRKQLSNDSACRWGYHAPAVPLRNCHTLCRNGALPGGPVDEDNQRNGTEKKQINKSINSCGGVSECLLSLPPLQAFTQTNGRAAHTAARTVNTV